MNFVFTDAAPWNTEPILISGTTSEQFPHKKYLIPETENQDEVYEIRYEYHCSPFKQAILVNNMLAVGFEEYFYLFDTSTKTNILSLKMEGYFSKIHANNDLFYTADAGGIHCIDKKGLIIWHNDNLGIDGVIINEFIDGKIMGSGEWDPPGGWQDFIIDEKTGLKLK